jgi:hypothetical protein
MLAARGVVKLVAVFFHRGNFMTLNQLIKRLQKLADAGHGRKRVCINKATFRHNLEGDGMVFHDVVGLGIQVVSVMDDDGGTKWRADGTEATSTIVVLAGGSGANSDGELIELEYENPA